MMVMPLAVTNDILPQPAPGFGYLDQATRCGDGGMVYRKIVEEIRDH